LFDSAQALKKSREYTCLLSPKQKESARILIVTPRASGSAPERNLVKRRLRSLFYENRLFEGQYDCAVIIKAHGAENITYDTLKRLINRIKACK
ncbi:MAG TPA: ribonuclease P protein component, partial [Candidatus Babeliales bacterium]|nr:ribonuclease P protein component [Candidatus Babeliales bacterium]